MRALIGLGVSASAVPYLTKEALAELTDHPDDEVPRVFKWINTNREEFKEPPYPEDPPRREPEFYFIPRDWWGYLEATKDGLKSVNEIINGIDRTGLIYISRRRDENNDKRWLVVKYTRIVAKSDDGLKIISEPAASYDELENHIPYQIDGSISQSGYQYTRKNIPIILEKNDIVLHHTCDPSGGQYYDYIYDDVPGGCQIKVEQPTQTETCTSTTPAWHMGKSEHVLLTAGHCTIDHENEEPPGEGEGRLVIQPYYDPWQPNGNVIGEVDEVCYGAGYSPHDWPKDGATIELTHRNHERALADNSANTYDENINGTVDWDCIEDGSLWSVFRQGKTTGRCWGSIVEDHPLSSSWKWFEVDVDSDVGDSGGPHFTKDENDDAYIAGLHKGRGGSSGHAIGLYIGDIESEFNIFV